MKNKIPILALCLLTGCAPWYGYSAGSTGAAPSVSVPVKSGARVISKLAELCDRHGFQIDTRSDVSITCSRESSGGAEFFYGTRGGSGVRSVVTFNIIETSGKTKIASSAWFVNENIYGQVQRTQASSHRAPVIDEILSEAAGELK